MKYKNNQISFNITKNRPHGIQQYAENVRSNASSRLNDICLGAPMSIIDVPIEAEDKTPVLICQNIQANSLNDLPKRQVLISDSERGEVCIFFLNLITNYFSAFGECFG